MMSSHSCSCEGYLDILRGRIGDRYPPQEEPRKDTTMATPKNLEIEGSVHLLRDKDTGNLYTTTTKGEKCDPGTVKSGPVQDINGQEHHYLTRKLAGKEL
jgi:hypothetical protein